ncbi:MAG: FKBP-type peptidyl-prolyl cis-trans isomerase [Flavisolibacter sp.]|nr:FKBP-type peptidyl-prolyl cis-trans isomerase [Flavisolibacter sp.]
MKTAFLCLLITVSTLLFAQQKKAPVAAKPAASASPFKTIDDSASYVIGLSVVNFYNQQGISKLNPTLVAKAIADVQAKKKPLLSDMECNSVMMRYMSSAQEAKSKPNIEAGKQFLETNKTKAGVQTTPSGLQYEVVVQGSGAKPTINDTVVCHYAGKLINGTEFDNSYKRGEPATFPVSGVIKGWTEALQMMPVGSKYKLYIPYNLAYGTNEAGPIPPGSLLIFDVELLKINGK